MTRLGRLAVVLLAFTGALRAQTFYTEYWSDLNSWINSSNAFATSGVLVNVDYSRSRLLYYGSIPNNSSDYSVQSTLSCPAGHYGVQYLHYLRASIWSSTDGYMVMAYYTYDDDNNPNGMQFVIFNGTSAIGAVATTSFCGTMTSSIAGNTLTVAQNGTVIYTAPVTTYPTGLPGVGTQNAGNTGYGITGIGTTTLATIVSAPNAPANLVASNVYAYQVNLSWSASSGGGTPSGYNIYRQDAGLGPYNNVGSIGSCSTPCRYTDSTTYAHTAYSYKVTAYSSAQLESGAAGPISFTSPTPSHAAPEVGAPVAYASTYGAAPEQISLLTGALGIRIPLAKFQHRSRGPGYGLSASWNSAFWTHDGSTGDNMIGMDTGYGLNFLFQVAAVYPVFNGSNLDRFEMQDGQGIIHKLYLVSGSTVKYKSQDSTYLTWDYSTRTLTWSDGTVWFFNCASLDPEPDSGTFYPTSLRDANGNLITISYLPASGGSQTNTSSRISTVQDSATTYYWTYDTTNYAVPHVTSVRHSSLIDASFSYTKVTGGLVSPYSNTIPSATSGTYVLLSSVTFTGAPGAFSFTYNTSGEITQLTLPYHGYFKYTYTNGSFAGGRATREIASRILSSDGTVGSEQTYSFSHPNDSSSNSAHIQTQVTDPTTNHNYKTWSFIYGTSPGWDVGLSNRMDTYQNGTSTPLRTVNTVWTQDNTSLSAIKNPRVCATTTILQDGGLQTTVEQDADANGNITEIREYSSFERTTGNGAPASSPCTSPGSGNPAGTIYRTTTTSYYTDSNSVSRNMLNLPLQIQVWSGSAGTGPVLSTKSFVYDNDCCDNISNLNQHDSTYGVNFIYRGNAWSVTTNGVTMYYAFDVAGNVVRTWDALSHQLQTTSYLGTGQVQSVTAGGNTTSVSYNGDLTTQGVTGSNGDTFSFGYAAFRPTYTQTSESTLVTYNYSDQAANGTPISPWSLPYFKETSSAAGRKSRVWMDGFGRTIRTATRESSGTFDVWISTQTVYDACSCSSSGKAVKTSRPYRSDINGNPIDASGNQLSTSTILWTTTISDGLGRPVSVTLPDGNSTGYGYVNTSATLTKMDGTTSETIYGSMTTITDPMYKHKSYFYDGFGNLRQVQEENSSGSLVETARYAYDELGRLRKVMMPYATTGDTVFQTRTFNYNSAGQLSSATTPEKGTVSYYYTSDGLLDHKTDAKSQTLWYFYDTNHRLLRIESPQGSVRTSFTYDTGTNGVGKMATASASGYTWSYAYDMMGRVTQQTLSTPFIVSQGGYSPNVPVSVSSQYTYDGDSMVTGMVYPGTLAWVNQQGYAWQPGTSYQYTNDAVGRASGLNVWNPGTSSWNSIASGTSYNAAGQMTGWTENGVALARTYDPARGSMVTASASLVAYPNTSYMNLAYAYNANGQATSVTENPGANQEVTNYTYDSLNRLASASTPSWGFTYAYDELGNRKSKTGTGGASSLSQTLSYDQTTNRINSTGYSYDANGNMIASPGASYGYDVFDRLAGTGVTYDAFGRRIAKNLPDGTYRFYVYDVNGREIAEYRFDPTQTCNFYGNEVACPIMSPMGPQTAYVYFAGQRVGQWTDRVGSKRNDAGGTQSHYYPYGEEITGTGSDTYKYASTYRDSDSGLDYAKNRYYVSGIGRFLTTDPFGGRAVSATKPASWNAYHYAGNDPINFHDPTGLLEAAPGYCPAEYESCDDPGGGPGDPGDPGGGGGPPSPPPLHCSFTGGSIAPPAEGASSNGFGFYLASDFNFAATGGTGTYEWYNTQHVTVQGSYSILNGTPQQVNDDHYETLVYGNGGQSSHTGATADVFDAPGWAEKTRRGNLTVTSVSVTWNFQLFVAVRSGDSLVACPEVDWSVTLQWTIPDGSTKPKVSGSGVITTKPTP